MTIESERNAAIFCAASEVSAQYKAPALELINLLAEFGFDMVYGGTESGLMKHTSTAMKKAGGKVFGVTLPHLARFSKRNADTIYVTGTLGDRKETMVDNSDAIVALIGGIGTLDELMTAIELKKQGWHRKPIVALNTDGFYDGLKMQLEKMSTEKVVTDKISDLVYFAQTPEDAMEYIIEEISRPLSYDLIPLDENSEDEGPRGM